MIFAADYHFSYLLLFFSAGYFFGMLTSLLDFLPAFTQKEWIFSLSLAIRLIFLGVFFVFISAFYSISGVRGYNLALCLLGFWLYLKTLRKIFAKYARKLYNIIIKKRILEKKANNDARKTKKNCRRSFIFGNNFARGANRNNDFANDHHLRQKGKNWST